MASKSYIIGRAGDITLYDDTVSRKHARLDVGADGLFLEDLGSRNGTYEMRDDRLVPFKSGPVTADQVFAFGECVRGVSQLLSEIGEPAPAVTAAEAGEPAAAAPDIQKPGLTVAPGRRLSPADIVALLEQVEDGIDAGSAVSVLCESLGFSEQRYLRWCKEYGATRSERDKTTAELRRENERLRKLVADLSLERDVLKDALKNVSDRPVTPGPMQSPSLSIVSDKKS